ncbi:helix-turn-helix domain-containing protein [Oceanobacillus damuensis]|uniref:helix-turn-helix domain-containing protein n=1 Tax=Oceanobacillus damuensis TaxID=937928 RepID=UPI000833A375|nr:helix-turn-helix transcriptional regulator [Oceanobacillus damuensis]
MHIHIKLNDLLAERKISHREFARMTGIRHPSISEMCNNASKHIPLKNLAKICEVLECDIADILVLKESSQNKI